MSNLLIHGGGSNAAKGRHSPIRAFGPNIESGMLTVVILRSGLSEQPRKSPCQTAVFGWGRRLPGTKARLCGAENFDESF